MGFHTLMEPSDCDSQSQSPYFLMLIFIIPAEVKQKMLLFW